MFTVIVVCSLKSMCVPSFIVIGVSYMAILYPYHNIMPEAVYFFFVVLQELHCLPNCLHACMIRVRGCYHFTKFHCSTPSSF